MTGTRASSKDATPSDITLDRILNGSILNGPFSGQTADMAPVATLLTLSITCSPWVDGWLLATGYWLLATGYWLLATGYWLLATPSVTKKGGRVSGPLGRLTSSPAIEPAAAISSCS
ncbi:hypothetical protein [Onishia taeanensis]|uniref:hypothetical protein n=1 Tax=Onishia taeanensis TaxID=284577 RepID=UPI000DD2F773|nr:hypothetical protein [Halomonas taeanensis]